MKKIIKAILFFVFIYICLMVAQTRNFNGLTLASYYEGKTNVSRDRQERYNNEWSYKIASQDYNDFMIYKTLNVQKNTAYKVSCMVKTNDIESQGKNYSGFNIGLKDGLEKSKTLLGTNDWTKLEFYFNSANNETIDIAFRLGDNDGNCKGTAWISDISIEEGRKTRTTEWEVAVFMFNHTNAKINDKTIVEDLTATQISAIEDDLERYKDTILDFSDGSIKINYNIININESLNNISYDEETGYFISPKDIYPYMKDYLYKGKNYDHIYVVANIGDNVNGNTIDWVGLGSMVYDSMGFSNIRISDNVLNSYQYSGNNYFPEEVLLHEFLHTLERNSKNLGNETIALHDYAKYGYINEPRYGLRQWYLDYIQKNIQGNLGLEEEVFYTQPVSEKNFKTRGEVKDYLYDNQNIVQKVIERISKII